MSYTVLIVEDDPKISTLVADFLTRCGCIVVRVQDFRRVEEEFLAARPHLVLMDVNLPYQDGFHLTRLIRRHSALPILFLSARAGEMEQVLGIESGGDDYVTKPFHLDVLHAKIKAMLRRAYGEYSQTDPSSRSVLQVGRLELDLAAGEVRLFGEAESQPLTRNEVKLLHRLMEKAGRGVSREECLEALWDDAAFVDDNTLTVNVTRSGRLMAANLGYAFLLSTIVLGSWLGVAYLRWAPFARRMAALLEAPAPHLEELALLPEGGDSDQEATRALVGRVLSQAAAVPGRTSAAPGLYQPLGPSDEEPGGHHQPDRPAGRGAGTGGHPLHSGGDDSAGRRPGVGAEHRPPRGLRRRLPDPAGGPAGVGPQSRGDPEEAVHPPLHLPPNWRRMETGGSCGPTRSGTALPSTRWSPTP